MGQGQRRVLGLYLAVRVVASSQGVVVGQVQRRVLPLGVVGVLWLPGLPMSKLTDLYDR